MKVGWNARYILHCLACDGAIHKSLKFCVLVLLLSSFVFVFPIHIGGRADSDALNPDVSILPGAAYAAAAPARDLASIEALLKQYGVQGSKVSRVAQAIVHSSKKYRMDARLVASIVIVESGANPYAVSEADSMGIMQIHLKTWAEVVDREDVNLFKVEDNVDFGVRILRSYIAANGLWEGVARYKGVTSDPESRKAADEYVLKVRAIYDPEPGDSSSANS
jgi:soluble lytic murein transglycosylase-like protein